VKQHLDAITCLIPLMGKPKVGLQAKEALLVAVSMHDRRVDRFILTETNLPRNIVHEMVKKFGVCVAASVTFVPITPATSGISRGEILSGAPSASVDPSSKSSIISFVKVLRFCAAFVSAASDQGGTEEFDGFMNIEDPSCASLQATVCDHYRDLFLHECVKPALLENGEQQVLVVQSLFRSMLLELSPSQSRKLGDSSLSSLNASAAQLLCTPTTALICEDRELLQTILRRAGSVFRPVSISTLQLLSTLLGAASMRESCRLILAPEEVEGGGSSGSKGNPGEQSPATPSKSLDIDTTLNKVISGAATKFGSIPWVGRCNAQGARENCSTNYMEAGLDRILSRLAGGIQCQGSEALLQIDPTMFPVAGSRPVGGPLLELTKRKLASFLTLKYDEQVAVTGLVEKCVTMLSTLLVLSGSDPMGNILLKLFIGLFESVSERVTELANHMKSFSDAEQKLEIICAVLNDPNCDQRYRRLIEKESMQVVRILETSLIVRELYREFEGSLLAVRQLRIVLIPRSVGGLISNTTSPSTTSRFTTPHSQHSRSPASLSPFFSHSSPFSHAVHSSIHLSSHEQQDHLCYSDSDSEESGDDGAPDGEEDGEEDDEDQYVISDEDLEERFLHECSLYEKDLDLILKNCEEEEAEGEGEEWEGVGVVEEGREEPK
jgi:hypothetical protein